jgi:hypothetical protein
MPREDYIPVTGKSIYTFLTSQRHNFVFDRSNFAFTSVPIGNVKGRRPDISISSSITIGAMAGLFVFIAFLLSCYNLSYLSLSSPFEFSRSSNRNIIQPQSPDNQSRIRF